MESLRLFERVCEVRALKTVFLQTESVQNFLDRVTLHQFLRDALRDFHPKQCQCDCGRSGLAARLQPSCYNCAEKRVK